MNRNTKIKAKEGFPITGHGFTSGKLLDGTDCLNPARYRCNQVLHVQVFLYAMQVSTCITKIFFPYSQDSGRKWTICQEYCL